MNKHDSYTSESNHSAVDSDLETAPTSSKKNDVDQTTNPSEQSIDQKNAKLKNRIDQSSEGNWRPERLGTYTLWGLGSKRALL